MRIELWWSPLWAMTLALSLSWITVLALRLPMRLRFGARAAYALWGLPVAALVALLVPAPSAGPVDVMALPKLATAATRAVLPVADSVDWRPLAVIVWLIGALGLAVILAIRQRRFQRSLNLQQAGDGFWRSARDDVSPMVVGLWRTRVVLPANFEHRFDADEQALVREHETVHLNAQDVRINALALVLLIASWFNPLAWWAWRTFRFDQELACDARVVERHPLKRRIYANAMLKAQLNHGLLPLGCHWSNTHPLHRRIAMLARKSPTSFTRLFGRLVVAAIALGFSYSIWAQKPSVAESSALPGKGDMIVSLSIEVGSEHIQWSSSPDADGHGQWTREQHGVVWRVDYTIKPKAPDRFVGTFKVLRDGQLQGHPTMEWLRDASASTRISNAAGETQFALDVRADVLDEDAVVIDANAREASEAPREAGTSDIADAAKNVEIIRQVDGSYRLDNMPKGLSPEQSEALKQRMMPTLLDTMRINGDAPAETEAPEATPAAGVSPVSIDFHPAWQIDFMAQANPPDQC